MLMTKNYLLCLLVGILIGSLLMLFIKRTPITPKKEVLAKEVKVVEQKVEITEEEFLSCFKRICYLDIDKAWAEFTEVRNHDVTITKPQFICFLNALYIISDTLIERDSMRLPIKMWDIEDQEYYIGEAIMMNVEMNNKILKHIFGERKTLNEFFCLDCKLFDISITDDNVELNAVQSQFMKTVERIKSKYDLSVYVSDKMKEVLTKERLNCGGKVYSYFDIMLANLLIYFTGDGIMLNYIMDAR